MDTRTYTLAASDCKCRDGYDGEVLSLSINDITVTETTTTVSYNFSIGCTDPGHTGKWNGNGVLLILNSLKSCTATDFPPVTKEESFSVTYTLTRTPGEHTYNHDCSRICSVCGDARENAAPHTLGTTWKTDAKNHWQICEVCKEKEISAHDLPSEDLFYDRTGHWYTCPTCGMEKVGYQFHKMIDNQDGSAATCSECPYHFQYIKTPILLDGFSMAGKKKTASLSLPESVPYYVDEASNKWYDAETNTPVTEFEDGKQYEFYLFLMAKDGYGFPESDTQVLEESLLQIEGINWDAIYSDSYLGFLEFGGFITYQEEKGISHDHTLTPVPAKASNCTQKGNKAYYACACGKWFEDANASVEITDQTSVTLPLDSKAHSFGSWVQTKAPTGTGKGEKVRTCSRCGHKEAAEIPAIGTTQAPENPTKPTQSTSTTQPSTPSVTESNAWKNSVLRLRGSAAKTSITLKWNVIPKADGYIVYGSNYGKKMKQLKVISGGKKTTWTIKKLKKANNYNYYVKAYKKINGKRTFIKTSNVAHFATMGGKYTNIKQLRAPASISLKAGKTKTISVKVTYAEKKKKLAAHMKPLRYSTTNSKIATVSSKGKVKAKKKGSCYIYVTASSGAYTKICHLYFLTSFLFICPFSF